MNDWQDLRGLLLAVLIRLEDRLPPDQVALIHEFIDAGEWCLALEQIADVLSEDEIGLRDDERADLLSLNTRMDMGNRVPQALTFCPSLS